jgi:regulator of sigma E protease
MEIAIQAAQFFLSLSILVILHEFGHFLPARWFGMRVEKFYLFFDPYISLLKKKIGDTEYGVGWVPLGGYVKISGMIDESMDKEQMAQPAQPWEFRAKPAWQRLIVMIGGVTVNVILGVLIYWMVLFVYGETILPAKEARYGIMCDSVALDMGLRNGDHILALDGKEVGSFTQIPLDIILNKVKDITVLRGDETLHVAVTKAQIGTLMRSKGFITPRVPFVAARFDDGLPAKAAGFEVGDSLVGINDSMVVYFDAFKTLLQTYKGQTVRVNLYRNGSPMEINIAVPEKGQLGIFPSGDMGRWFQLHEVQYGVVESFPRAMQKAYNTFDGYIKQMSLIFSPEAKGYENVGGFITIGSIFSPVWDWHQFWNITAFLSIVLAFMNILPIPALDGGHVIFLLWEVVTGRKPSDKVLEVAQYIGMLLLLSLLVLANGNDIYKLIFK